MEKVAHRINEDYFGFAPAQWLRELFRNQAQIKTLFVRMPLHPTKAFSESFGVAVFAAWADFGATTDGIPRGVRPLNGRSRAHILAFPGNVTITLSANETSPSLLGRLVAGGSAVILPLASKRVRALL